MAKKQPLSKTNKQTKLKTSKVVKDEVLQNELVDTVENNKEENQEAVEVLPSTEEVTSSLTTPSSTSEKEDKEKGGDDEDEDKDDYRKKILKDFAHDQNFKKVFKKIKKTKKIIKLLNLKKGHKKILLQNIKGIKYLLENEIINKESQKFMDLIDKKIAPTTQEKDT